MIKNNEDYYLIKIEIIEVRVGGLIQRRLGFHF